MLEQETEVGQSSLHSVSACIDDQGSAATQSGFWQSVVVHNGLRSKGLVFSLH